MTRLAGMGVLLLAVFAGFHETRVEAALEPAELRCEFRVNPLGIDAVKPRLNWILKSADRGQRQTAYQVLVASNEAKLVEGQADLWDSGKVTSDESNQVQYAGKSLTSEMRCLWKVRVWDSEGKPSVWSPSAMWSMGLLKPGDWQAKWINLEAPVDTGNNLQGCKWVWYPEGEPQKSAPLGKVYFRKRLEISAGKKIQSASFLLSADDEFVLWVNGTEVAKKQGQIDGWKSPVTADVAKALREGENVIAIEAANVGPTPNPAGLIGRLTVKFDEGAPLQVAIDSSWKTSKQKAEGWEKAGLDDAAWAAAKEVAAYGEGPWTAAMASNQRMLPAPFFRKTFAVEKEVKRATLYATALGIYQVSLNGKPVGRDVLAPGWSDFRFRVNSFAYDVTDQVKSGQNVVGAVLGDGWYGSYLAFTGKRRFYGGAPCLMLQLNIETADGAKTTVGTDSTWKGSFGPIVQADLLMGQTCDGRLEMPGWNTVGFDDVAWKPAKLADAPKILVESHPGMPIRPQEELPAKKMTEPKPGVYIYDLGQNMVGWVRLKVRGKAGQEITVRHAEMLNPDGTMYVTNLRAAKATDKFILGNDDGGAAWICEPTLTFHGFRYVEVTGVKEPLKLDDVVGVVVHSDIPRTCWFECSNPLVNKLVENTHWGQKGNYLDVPTDCPQRDERAGWTADAQVFTKAAAFNRDISSFLTKWLVDLCQDGQREDGAYPDVAPSILGHGNAVWEDAAVICTYQQYQMFGDTRCIEQHYPRLVKFMDHLQKSTKNCIREAGAYGDWLLLAGPQHSPIHGTAYYYYCATLMADMAQAIGKTDDVKRWRDLAKKIREVYIQNFVHADGKIHDTSKKTGQTLYALSLVLGLVPDELKAKAAEHLIDDIKSHDWHLATGFIGTPVLLQALEAAGRGDVAYRIALNETYPSWLAQVKLGSTTMWERWDGWLPNKGFQDPGMNSFNHYWLGCIGEWLYTRVAGLDTDGPGFKKIVIRPLVVTGKNGFDFAKVRYQSIRGPIESGWKVADGKLTMDIVIPANTTATVYVPAADAAKVTEGGKPAAEAAGVKFLKSEAGRAVYEVGSGSYSFATEYRP